MNYEDYMKSLREIANLDCGDTTCGDCALKVKKNCDCFDYEYKTRCMSIVVKRALKLIDDGYKEVEQYENL